MTDFPVLVLRLDAPLMSFGGVKVDEHNVTEPFPQLSLLTGLLGNALGYEHADADALQRLQDRVRFAARCDKPGEELVDYQTVDLGQPHLNRREWTTYRVPQGRTGGVASKGTHIRYRYYWADARHTVVLTLDPIDERPTLAEVRQALRQPERPLFLGRKCCIPSRPLFVEELSAPSLHAALKLATLDERADIDRGVLMGRWPEREGEPEEDSRRVPVTDERDWTNQIHTGRRFVREGTIPLNREETPDAG